MVRTTKVYLSDIDKMFRGCEGVLGGYHLGETEKRRKAREVVVKNEGIRGNVWCYSDAGNVSCVVRPRQTDNLQRLKEVICVLFRQYEAQLRFCPS